MISADKVSIIDALCKYVDSPDTLPIPRVQGSPGTGKTTLIRYFLNTLHSRHQVKKAINPNIKDGDVFKVYLTASINKAVTVLESEVALPMSTEEGGNNVKCLSLYQFLNLSLKWKESGERVPVLKRGCSVPRITRKTLLIIDEWTHIDSKLYDWIADFLYKNLSIGNNGLLKIIVLGDKYQSRPINGDLCDFINLDELVLTTRNRYPENSAIHYNSLACEQAIESNKTSKLVFDSTFKTISNDVFMDQYLKSHLANPTLNAIFIGYTNDRVNEINNAVYHLTSGTKGASGVVRSNFTKGDTVIVNSGGFMLPETKLVISEFNPFSEPYWVSNNISITVNKYKIKGRENVYFLPVNKSEYDIACNALKRKMRFMALDALNEKVMFIRHGWGITCHKAQGITVDYAFVDYNNLKLIQEREDFFRLFNVAITRARKQVFLIRG